MTRIELTPEELRSQAQEMASLQTEFETLFNGTSSLLTTINGNWSALLANNFEGKINSAQNAFHKVVEMLGKGSELANLSANTYQSMDSLLAKATFQTAGGGVAAAFSTASGSVMSKAGNVLSDFWDYLKKDTVESWNETKNVIEYFEGLYEKIPEEQRTLLEEAYKKVVPKDWRLAWETTSNIITGDVSWDDALKIGQYVTEKNPKANAIVRTFDYLKDTWDSYTSADSQAMDLILDGQIVNGMTQEIGVFTNYVVGGVVDIVGGWGVDLVEKIPGVSLIENVTGIDLGEKWDGAMDTMHSTMDSAFEYAGEKLQDGADYVIDGAKKIGSAVGDGLSKIGSGITGWFKKK